MALTEKKTREWWTCLGSLVLGSGADLLFDGDFAPVLNLMAVPPALLSLLLLTLRRSTSLVHG